MAINQEKLEYILHHFDYYTENLVWDVIHDNPDDPEYSAVTATNCIKSFIEVRQGMGEELPYSTVEEYLRIKGASDEECLLFEESRAKEAVSYIGEQY